MQLVLRDAGQEAGVGDLVAVQVEDGQHAAVAGRVQELVAVPARRERSGLGLAVADDARHDQVGIVEGRAEGVRERVAELAAFVDRAGRLGSHVAGDAAREAELLEQPPHPLLVLADVRIDLAVGPFEVGVRDQRRAAVPGADHVDHVQVVLLDHPVQVRVEEVQAGRGAPVSEQPRLDVLARERLAQQRVVEQVDLPDREVVRGAPERVDLAEVLCGEGGGKINPTLRRRRGLHGFTPLAGNIGRSTLGPAPALASEYAREVPQGSGTQVRTMPDV